jgi:hypothetical protein
MAKKIAFWTFFFRLLFEIMLKYMYVSQQANINRQQAVFNRHFISLSVARPFGPAGPNPCMP